MLFRSIGDAAGVNWYSGISFSLMKPMLIDASHKYLHVLVSAPVDAQVVNFGVKQGANLLTDVPKTVTLANVWQDMVVDLSAMAFISDVYIKCGSAGATAAGDYYFDEIRIDGDPTPRSNTPTALNPTVINSKIFSANGNIIIENNSMNSKVAIFNSCGQRIFSNEIGSNASIQVTNKGVYLVNIENKITKVIVK